MMSKIIDQLGQQNELSSNVRFTIPKTDAEVMQAQHSSVPKTTAKSTKWAVNIWKMWSQNRCELNGDGPSLPQLLSLEMLELAMQICTAEIRRKDGKEYPPNTPHWTQEHRWCSSLQKNFRRTAKDSICNSTQ